MDLAAHAAGSKHAAACPAGPSPQLGGARAEHARAPCAQVQAGHAGGVRAVVAGVRSAGVAQGSVEHTPPAGAHVQACGVAGERAVVAGVPGAGVAPNKWTCNPLVNAHVQAGGAAGVRAPQPAVCTARAPARPVRALWWRGGLASPNLCNPCNTVAPPPH